MWHLYVVRTPRRDALRGAPRRRPASRPSSTTRSRRTASRRTRARPLAGCDLPVADRITATVLSLPNGPHMHDDQVDRVIEAVADFG